MAPLDRKFGGPYIYEKAKAAGRGIMPPAAEAGEGNRP